MVEVDVFPFSSNRRYSTFWVLYPIGVAAELWTTTSALKEAYAWNPLYAAFMAAVMVGYIPGMVYPFKADDKASLHCTHI